MKTAKLMITDNGCGFDLNNSRRFGNGLINMKKRMEAIGGDYKIESTIGQGTTTTLMWQIR
jgi:signal transduction histidine kinase